MRVAVTGATGRMGREVLQAARSRDCSVAFEVSRTPADADIDEPVVAPADFADALAEHDPDAVVDFTVPEAAVAYVEAAADAGVPVVTGTTGFSDAEETALRDAGESIPLVRGANFSRGVQALLSVARTAVAALPEYDVELTETHHNGKRDAPSGTAKRILDAVESEREDAGERVHGREGDAPRQPGEIGVHARRAGDITGEHELLLAGNDEALELTHRAGDRGVFAAGALDAARFVQDAEPDYYRFSDIAADL
ncbi:4-hydroxy-tetrahydrodipicolinate reductase [Salarchaeum japonicum]|uniref:4-hydroxy-tetrahydrodipicolinate reductase n=1 Tax=Salarchaeum japonicum TaxID=555573 RepID=UPI003C790032